MNNRAIKIIRWILKIIRWILLAPLTFAVPTIVFSWLSWLRDYGGYYENARSFWVFISRFAPLVAQWFIPALLTIPTACAIAPSHRKETSIITLVFFVCFWLLAFIVLPDMDTGLFYDPNPPFPLYMLCALWLGLAAGFAVVRLALTRLRRPF